MKHFEYSDYGYNGHKDSAQKLLEILFAMATWDEYRKHIEKNWVEFMDMMQTGIDYADDEEYHDTEDEETYWADAVKYAILGDSDEVEFNSKLIDVVWTDLVKRFIV